MLAGEVVIFHFLDFLHFGWRSDGGDSGHDDDAESDELEEWHIAWVSVAFGRIWLFTPMHGKIDVQVERSEGIYGKVRAKRGED
eukprot:CAMPEP_0197529410 /NCGR_PEP_ID=MMETSP1318-20131121/28324_1 /TAXON_ID=552666 /ORGANISM="Partenskyella glossopodia, Strain RCC365" /LENGTH=83 /DNA_ID=CAMNT_0043084863 /DNA_START=428 /DNA_END=679 /DNA_ORIENTATION=+